MKNYKYLIILFGVIFLLFLIFIFFNKNDKKITKFDLDKTSIKLDINETYQINIITDDTSKKFEYASLNSDIAFVSDDGLITALSSGETSIKVKNLDLNVEKEIKVVVSEDSFLKEFIKTEYTKKYLLITETFNYTAQVIGTNNTSLTWISENEEIATVDNNGTVYPHAIGSTKITVTNGSVSSSCIIEIVDIINEEVNNDEKTDENPIEQPSNNPDITTEVSTTNSTTSNVTSIITNANTTTGTTTTTTTTTIPINYVTLTTNNVTLYINAKSNTYTASAKVNGSAVSNSSLTWSSSNTGVAKVSNGVITPVAMGTATIYASNGQTKASLTVTVKKKVIVEVGASQSDRFFKYGIDDYSSSLYNYHCNEYSATDTIKGGTKKYCDLDSTLIHITRVGAGMKWQYEEGQEGTNRVNEVFDHYKNYKQYVDIYVYYLLIGNTIKTYSCDDINFNNNTYTKHLNGYDKSISTFKSSGYNVKGYVVSMHPLNIHATDRNKESVVANYESTYCDTDIRSNWKYHLYNSKIKESISTTYPNIKYVETFESIMDVTRATSTKRTYFYKITYTSESDGVHFDAGSAAMYLKLMFDKSNADI